MWQDSLTNTDTHVYTTDRTMTTLSAMVERKSTRVFGVGVGVFLIGFFFVLSLLICCLGSLTARPR